MHRLRPVGGTISPLKVCNSPTTRNFWHIFRDVTLRALPKRIQGKVKLEKNITELVTKVNKHSEGLVVGKLPAKWHMPLQTEEDIGKERTKLDELQAELR